MRFALLLLACLAAAPAFACRCKPRWTSDTPRLSNDESIPTAAELKQKDLVLFFGKAVKVTPVPTGDPERDEYGGSDVKFVVLGHWEDELPLEVIVHTPSTGGGCGFVFEAGKQYVVFATRYEGGKLVTGICARTTLDGKVPDLRDRIIFAIGQPKEPKVIRRKK